MKEVVQDSLAIVSSSGEVKTSCYVWPSLLQNSSLNTQFFCKALLKKALIWQSGSVYDGGNEVSN